VDLDATTYACGASSGRGACQDFTCHFVVLADNLGVFKTDVRISDPYLCDGVP